MNSVTALHHQAMEFADKGMIASVKGPKEDVQQYYEQAYNIEKQAVSIMPLGSQIPVPRPVFIRGAAALAYRAGLFEEAEQMIALCRSENPPAFVLRELKDIEKLMRTARKIKNGKGNLHIIGMLAQADAVEQKIKVFTDNRLKPYSVHVPAELLDDIVKSYWGDEVEIVAALHEGGQMMLKKINRAA